MTNELSLDVTVLLNDGQGSFSETQASPIDMGSRPGSITAGDWDGDGDLDLAVVNFFIDNVAILLNG